MHGDVDFVKGLCVELNDEGYVVIRCILHPTAMFTPVECETDAMQLLQLP